MPPCQLHGGCEFPASARVTLSRHPSGPVYLTAVPIAWATSGIPGCFDHIVDHLSALLMHSRGPATPPSIEQAPGGSA